MRSRIAQEGSWIDGQGPRQGMDGLLKVTGVYGPKTLNTMNRHTTFTITTMAALCLGIALGASDALGQQKPLKELIVGTWILESVYDQTEDGVKHNPWGDGVKGQAMFDAQGHFSWMIMSANRAKAEPVRASQLDKQSPSGAPIRLTKRQRPTQTNLSVVHFLSGMEEEVRQILHFLRRMSSTSPLRNLFQIHRWGGLSHHI